MANIKVLSGSGFVEQITSSETLCELRTELDIPESASVSVNGVNQRGSYNLQDGDHVAAAQQNKTGGITNNKTGKPKKGKMVKPVKRTTKVRTTKTVYNSLGQMSEAVRGVLHSFINQDSKYTTREGAVIGNIYGHELKRMKLELEVHKAGIVTNPAKDVLKLG